MAPTLAFIAVTVAVMLTPGPAVLFAVTRTAHRGRRAGLITVAGLECGLAVHAFGAAAGLTALLAASPATLTVLRSAGAGYLLLLAAQQLRPALTARAAAPEWSPALRRSSSDSVGRLFLDGFLVDLLNPKTMLFFLALLPQFARSGPALGLAALAVAIACTIDLGWVLATSWLLAAGRLRRPRWQPLPGLLSGGLYAGLAVVALMPH